MTKRTYRAYVDLPTRHSTLIGKIIVKHAFLERYLINIVYGLSGLDRETGDLIVRNPRTTDIVIMIEDLCEHQGIEIEKKSFSNLKSALQNLKTIRDSLAHNTWVKDPKINDPVMVSIKGKWDENTQKKYGAKRKRVFNPGGQPISREFLYGIEKRCDEMIDEVVKLMTQLGLDS